MDILKTGRGAVGTFGSLCLGLLLLAFLGAGIYALVVYARERKKGAETQAWPSTMGRVVEAFVVEETQVDSEGDSNRVYAPHVVYEYEVNGTLYRGDRLRVGLRSFISSRRKVEQELALYPVGGQVRVYYNSENPAEAVLQPGKSSRSALIIGIAFLVIAGITACLVGVAVLSSMASQ
jgi:hypothetical protein